MPKPAGAIAAALLVGERRFISEDVYNRFRDSGLAHLLAISGLHMGLICFGSMAVIRFLVRYFHHGHRGLPCINMRRLRRPSLVDVMF
jgi:predicted membrane metal-binding protein